MTRGAFVSRCCGRTTFVPASCVFAYTQEARGANDYRLSRLPLEARLGARRDLCPNRLERTDHDRTQ